MSVVTKEKKITSCNDFELNIKRVQKLVYRYSYPTSKKLNGIVFIIAGFGNDANSEYSEKLRTYIAKTFSVVAVNVFYHCYFSRIENGATLEFDELDIQILTDIINKYKIDFSDVKQINKDTVLQKMNEAIGILKAKGRVSEDFKLMLPMTIIPKHNEYQNFGVMQAVDHLFVLRDIKKLPLDFSDNINTILIGSSHGGYIAHLVAKFAPHLIDCVIDNSCYVKPPLSYIMGKETNILQPEYRILYENIKLHCFVQTLWTTNKYTSSYFSNDRYQIRNLYDEEHIEAMVNHSGAKTKYISYHSSHDSIAPIQDKINFYDTLKSFGFDATLKVINSEKDIDGKFIKTLAHGLDMSLKELANKELPQLLNQKQKKSDSISKIVYDCDEISYYFDFKDQQIGKCIAKESVSALI